MSTIKISKALLPTALGVLLTLGGCYSSPSPRPADSSYGAVSDDDIMKITYDATEILLQRSQQALTKSTPILVATFVNIDQLDESSTLGRIMAEAISDRMTQLGYYISEVKLRGTMMVKKDVGQLMLSRDLQRIRQEHNAQAVVAGTYAVGRYKVHVSMKLINATTGRVISALTYYLHLGPDTKTLLGIE